MTDDEEKQLKRELLALDLSLRRKQDFWETPRNIAILVGLTAAVAAAIGFWLGRESGGPPAPLARPVASLWFGEVRGDEFIDATQTAGIIVIAAMLVYVVLRLERAVTIAAEKMQQALATQQSLHERITRVWQRVDLIESTRNTPAAELKVALDEVNSRLDQLEAKK